MRILITGGTGFLGQRLIAKLNQRHDIVVFDTREYTGPEKIESIVGDILHDTDKLKGKRFNVVYHLAAILDETNPDLWKVNVNGTRNLLDCCINRKLERFIFVSPIGVLGETKKPAKENFPYNPTTKYEKSKTEAERLIMDYHLRYKIPYTIIRSTIVYGPNNFWRQIFEAAKNGYPLIGPGNNYWHLVYVDDAVDALELALHPRAKNQIYNIAGPDAHTYKETYEIMNKVLGLAPPEKSVPVPVAKAAALSHELSSKLKQKKPDVTKVRASIDRLVRNRIVSIEKANKEN